MLDNNNNTLIIIYIDTLTDTDIMSISEMSLSSSAYECIGNLPLNQLKSRERNNYNINTLSSSISKNKSSSSRRRQRDINYQYKLFALREIIEKITTKTSNFSTNLSLIHI